MPCEKLGKLQELQIQRPETGKGLHVLLEKEPGHPRATAELAVGDHRESGEDEFRESSEG